LIYQLAGAIGVDPANLTLKELLWMSEGRGKDVWARASNLMALIANCNRDPKKSKVFKPSDFNPYYIGKVKEDSIVITTENVGIMREAFTGVK
jgi:hypothetical protein